MEQRMILSAESESAEVMRCIDDCERCHRVCLRTAMNYCVEQGGDYVEPGHLRAMYACADLCRATTDAMLSSFSYQEVLCEACSRVCLECAESCKRLGEMQECIDACRRCAESCQRISGVAIRG